MSNNDTDNLSFKLHITRQISMTRIYNKIIQKYAKNVETIVGMSLLKKKPTIKKIVLNTTKPKAAPKKLALPYNIISVACKIIVM